jgi:CBS-domain-containing membrane protein
MLARDVMTKPVVTVRPDASVPEIARLLLDRHISAVPVVDGDGRVLGIVSEGDLIRRPEVAGPRRRSWWLALLSGGAGDAAEYVKTHGGQASDVMTRPAVTVTEDTPAGDIARLLEERRIKRVPVVRQSKLVGIVSRADLLRGLASSKPSPRKGPRATDQAIRQKLLRRLERESWAPFGQMNVIVTDGVVHLWGLVDSTEQRKALLVAAREVSGVRGVEDHLGEVPPYLRGT